MLGRLWWTVLLVQFGGIKMDDKLKIKVYNFIVNRLIDIEDFFSGCENKVNKFRCKVDEKIDEIDLKYGEN